MPGKKYILPVILIFLLINFSNLYAGTTGKIAGKIIDAGTKGPLIGANVFLRGTTLGAATDRDGKYFIINFPKQKF